MPIARALRLCPQAMCVPVPRGACSAKHREIRRVLERFTPIVEGASIDEWYLDLGGTESLYRGRTLADLARDIREAVRAGTGMSVSIGGGTSRLVAKLAVELAKPHRDPAATGVHIVAPGGELDFMRRLELGDIPFVGPRFRERLARVGLRTVEDVLAHDRPTLERWLGEREAAWLHDRVRGLDDTPVRAREVARSISREDTFAEDIAGDEALERELLRLVVRVAADLRGDGLAARTVTVKLRDFRFRTRTASRTLDAPVVADRVIFETARDLLRRLRRADRSPARLLGVALTSLGEPDADAQLSLFDGGAAPAIEGERDRALVAAVDRLRARFGPDAILPARLAT
jgi:DNA polymerase-4